MKDLISHAGIEGRIFIVRGKRVMLDSDLAKLYGVKPIRLREQVGRNMARFPQDFMFRLTAREAAGMVSHNAIPSFKHLGGYLPYVFTQEGVAMLSGVLRSARAVQVNIAIMRAFVKLREVLATHKDLALRLDALEQKYDAQFRSVFDAIRALMEPSGADPKRIEGFKP